MKKDDWHHLRNHRINCNLNIIIMERWCPRWINIIHTNWTNRFIIFFFDSIRIAQKNQLKFNWIDREYWLIFFICQVWIGHGCTSYLQSHLLSSGIFSILIIHHWIGLFPQQSVDNYNLINCLSVLLGQTLHIHRSHLKNQISKQNSFIQKLFINNQWTSFNHHNHNNHD